jgi:hypothetical protein
MTFAKFPDRPPVSATRALVYLILVAGCVSVFVGAWWIYRVINPG